jgi:hypothetical protein
MLKRTFYFGLLFSILSGVSCADKKNHDQIFAGEIGVEIELVSL